jgi:hypothetical protein
VLVGWSVGWLVGPHITSKTGYVAIASRRGEGRGNQLMLKTDYVEIALRLVTVALSWFINKDWCGSIVFEQLHHSCWLAKPMQIYRSHFLKPCAGQSRRGCKTLSTFNCTDTGFVSK